MNKKLTAMLVLMPLLMLAFCGWVIASVDQAAQPARVGQLTSQPTSQADQIGQPTAKDGRLFTLHFTGPNGEGEIPCVDALVKYGAEATEFEQIVTCDWNGQG